MPRYVVPEQIVPNLFWKILSLSEAASYKEAEWFKVTRTKKEREETA